MYYQGRVHCTFPLCIYKIHGDGPPTHKQWWFHRNWHATNVNKIATLHHIQMKLCSSVGKKPSNLFNPVVKPKIPFFTWVPVLTGVIQRFCRFASICMIKITQRRFISKFHLVHIWQRNEGEIWKSVWCTSCNLHRH